MSTYDDAMDTSPDKGKGKLQDDTIAEPVEEEEAEETSGDEEDPHALPLDEVEHDPLEEIDTNNIVQGRRTRPKPNIDYTQVDQTGLDEDDDDDDDEDFQEKSTVEDDDADKMEQ